MLLRSGKVLKPLAEPVEKVTQIPEDEMDLIKELKIFFRSLFYHCFTAIANKRRIDDIERTKGRKATLDEIIEWKADQTFWEAYFLKSRMSMASELPQPKLLQVFDCFAKQEHNLHEEDGLFIKMKSFVKDFLSWFYYSIDSKRMVTMMNENEDHPKKLYLQEIASEMASLAIHPIFNNLPSVFTWETFARFKSKVLLYSRRREP
jgi:hypothetical protein